MSREWYYESDRGVVGPQTIAQLRDRALAREIDQNTPVREGSIGDWMPARWILGPNAWGLADRDPAPPRDGVPLVPQRGTTPRNRLLRRGDIGIAVCVLLLICLGVPVLRDVRQGWRREAAHQVDSRPETLILGRWEHVPKVGAKQSVVFYTDGVMEYDGPTEGMDFERHVRYRFIDDRTVALLLTEASIRSLKGQFPEKRDQLSALRPGDEFGRLTFSFPSSRTMVVTFVNGNQVTWTKAD